MGETENPPRKLWSSKKLSSNDTGTSEDVHYHLLHEGVPKEFQKYAETELNETTENVTRGMARLKEFLRDKNMTDVDDNTLRLVLRNCKYDLKKSVAKMEKFLKARNFILEKVSELDLKKVDYILEDKSFAFLPYRDKLGRVIFLTQLTLNLDFYDIHDVFICHSAMTLYLMTLPMTSLFGCVYIADAKYPSVPLMYKVLRIYKSYLWILFCLPIQIRKIIVINENFLARWFHLLIRPIVPTKIYKRVLLTGDNLDILQEFYHPDILPEEYGGNMGPLNNAFFRDELINFMKKLKAEHSQKSTTKNFKC